MLDDIKRYYASLAYEYLGPDWKKIDKNECVKKFCDAEDGSNEQQGYLSAAMVKYWPLVDSYIRKSNGAYPPETVYDWLTHCFFYARQHKPWEPGGNLANQKNGPDKAINIYMKSTRQGFYQWSNSQKRAGQFNQNYSLDKIMEDVGDSGIANYIEDPSANLEFSSELISLVQETFKTKHYMGAFIIDGILNAPVFESVRDADGYPCSVFNKKKLAKHLRNIDQKYCKIFANMYKIPESEVISAREECSTLSSTRIYTLIKNTLCTLSRNLLFKDAGKQC